MSGAARVAAFVALLAAIFAGAALAGGALDPSGGGDGAGHGAAGDHGATSEAHGATGDHGAADASGAADGGHEGEQGIPAGVASVQDGYRLVAERTRFAAGRTAPLRLRILDAGGADVRDFEIEQARRLHLIVVRRDLRGYQHLHPAQGPDGAWTVALTLPDAGVYRAFADFRSGSARHTLGVDLFVPGDFAPRDLPAARRTAHTDGYDVTLERRDRVALTFSVRRGGRPVADLQDYLGARGHLVMLRDGDLAYRHVHPLDEPGLAFHTGAIEAGSYRLFLQFRHGDAVHTATFTVTR